MASQVIGSLVYDIVAETAQFNRSIGASGRELTALRKSFIDSASDAQRLQMDMQGLARVSRFNEQTLEATARRFGQIAAESREASAEAKRFTASLQEQARAQREMVKGRPLSDAERGRIGEMERAAAAFRKSAHEATMAAQAESRRNRELERAAAAQRRASETQELLNRRRQDATRGARASEARRQATEQAELNRMLRASEQPAQRIARQMGLLRSQYQQGAITAAQFRQVQRQLARELTEAREQARRATAEFQAQERAERKAAEAAREHARAREQANRARQQARQRARDTARSDASRVEAQEMARARQIVEQSIPPTQRLARDMQALRQARAAGVITDREFAQGQRHLANEMRRLKRAQDQQVQSAKAWRSQVAGMARQIGLITAAYAAWRVSIESTQQAMDIQRQQLAFEVFTGSAEQARGIMQDLRDIAARTPLTVGSSVQATRTMLQYGVAASDVVRRLEQLGDISGGSREQLQRLSLAVGQITANGRLQGQELRQLTESGFNPLMTMAEQTGKSVAELRVEMAEGAISAEMFGEALDSATSEGGRFNGMLKRTAEETPFGKIQILRGELEKLRIDLASMSTSSLGELATDLTETLRLMRDLGELYTAIGGTPQHGFDALKRTVEGINAPLSEVKRTLEFAREYYEWLMSMVPEDIELPEPEPEETKKDLSEIMKANADLNNSLAERIAALKRENDIMRVGNDIVELREFAQKKASTELLEMLATQQRINRELKEEEQARQRIHSELQRQQQERREELRVRREAAEQVHRNLQSPRQRELDDLRQALQDVRRLQQGGAITLDVSRREQERLQNAFIETQVDRIVQEHQAATAATKGSAEEFRLISRMIQQNSEVEDRDAARHDEAQRLRQELIDGIEALPEGLEDLFPVPVE